VALWQWGSKTVVGLEFYAIEKLLENFLVQKFCLKCKFWFKNENFHPRMQFMFRNANFETEKTHLWKI